MDVGTLSYQEYISNLFVSLSTIQYQWITNLSTCWMKCNLTSIISYDLVIIQYNVLTSVLCLIISKMQYIVVSIPWVSAASVVVVCISIWLFRHDQFILYENSYMQYSLCLYSYSISLSLSCTLTQGEGDIALTNPANSVGAGRRVNI